MGGGSLLWFISEQTEISALRQLVCNHMPGRSSSLSAAGLFPQEPQGWAGSWPQEDIGSGPVTPRHATPHPLPRPASPHSGELGPGCAPCRLGDLRAVFLSVKWVAPGSQVTEGRAGQQRCLPGAEVTLPCMWVWLSGHHCHSVAQIQSPDLLAAQRAENRGLSVKTESQPQGVFDVPLTCWTRRGRRGAGAGICTCTWDPESLVTQLSGHGGPAQRGGRGARKLWGLYPRVCLPGAHSGRGCTRSRWGSGVGLPGAGPPASAVSASCPARTLQPPPSPDLCPFVLHPHRLGCHPPNLLLGAAVSPFPLQAHESFFIPFSWGLRGGRTTDSTEIS